MKNPRRARRLFEGPMTDAAAQIETEAVRIAGEPGRTPFVFASPHSGRHAPVDIGVAAGVTAEEIGSADDVLVDALIAGGAAMGATLVLAGISRAYVDMNRSADEIDPELTPGVAGGGARAAGGYGVIHRLSGRGRALYDRPISQEEARARIEAVHAPYHAALAQVVETARDRFGYAVLIDWHSMPTGPRGRGASQVVLGDRHGGACTGGLTREARRLFEAAGLITALNSPYAGGWTTQSWGRPDEGLHALQVEIARPLYLDAAGAAPGPGFDRTRRIVERVMAGLLALGPDVFGAAHKKTAAGAAVKSL